MNLFLGPYSEKTFELRLPKIDLLLIPAVDRPVDDLTSVGVFDVDQVRPYMDDEYRYGLDDRDSAYPMYPR